MKEIDESESEKIKNRGRKPRKKSVHPALEYVAASWLLRSWGEKLTKTSNTSEKKKRENQLIAKLPDLQDAVVKNICEGKMEDIPDEIVLDEYKLFKPQFLELHKEIIKQGYKKAVVILTESKLEMDVSINEKDSIKIERPVFISNKSGEAEILASGVASKSVNAETFCRSLIGELFNLNQETVRRKCKKAEVSRRDKASSTNILHQIFIGLFVIGSSLPKSHHLEETLIYIIDLLYKSGYHTLKIYHLALFVSTLPLTLHSDLDWRNIDNAIKGINNNFDSPKNISIRLLMPDNKRTEIIPKG